MKLLLDSCVGRSVSAVLSDAGYDTVWAGDWEKDPGDRAILNRAFQEERILITLDKDFGELAIIKGIPHKGILRLVNLDSRQQGIVGLAVIEQYAEELFSGAIITASEERVRIRPPD